MKEQKKQTISEDMTNLLRQLVVNSSIRMAGTILFVYFKRCWKINDELAGYYVVKYFEKYYPIEMVKHREQTH